MESSSSLVVVVQSPPPSNHNARQRKNQQPQQSQQKEQQQQPAKTTSIVVASSNCYYNRKGTSKSLLPTVTTTTKPLSHTTKPKKRYRIRSFISSLLIYVPLLFVATVLFTTRRYFLLLHHPKNPFHNSSSSASIKETWNHSSKTTTIFTTSVSSHNNNNNINNNNNHRIGNETITNQSIIISVSSQKDDTNMDHNNMDQKQTNSVPATVLLTLAHYENSNNNNNRNTTKTIRDRIYHLNNQLQQKGDNDMTTNTTTRRSSSIMMENRLQEWENTKNDSTETHRDTYSSSVDYIACCGLGHRLIRMSCAYDIAKQLQYELRTFWGWCENDDNDKTRTINSTTNSTTATPTPSMEIFSSLFDPLLSSTTVQRQDDEVYKVQSTNRMITLVNNIPNYVDQTGYRSLLSSSNKLIDLQTYDLTTQKNNQNCYLYHENKVQNDIEFYLSLRNRFKLRKNTINSFRKYHHYPFYDDEDDATIDNIEYDDDNTIVDNNNNNTTYHFTNDRNNNNIHAANSTSRFVIGLHIRGGNGETGDFQEKKRQIQNETIWIQNVCHHIKKIMTCHNSTKIDHHYNQSISNHHLCSIHIGNVSYYSHVLLYIATDTYKYIETIRSCLHTIVEVISWEQQERPKSGEGVFFGMSKIRKENNNDYNKNISVHNHEQLETSSFLNSTKDDGQHESFFVHRGSATNNNQCLRRWEDTIIDQILLSYSNLLISGMASTFSQSLPLSLVFHQNRNDNDNNNNNRRRKKSSLVNESYCEIRGRYGESMKCFQTYVDWFCERNTFQQQPKYVRFFHDPNLTTENNNERKETSSQKTTLTTQQQKKALSSYTAGRLRPTDTKSCYPRKDMNPQFYCLPPTYK